LVQYDTYLDALRTSSANATAQRTRQHELTTQLQQLNHSLTTHQKKLNTLSITLDKSSKNQLIYAQKTVADSQDL
jgi:hypothetical protein